VWLNETRSGLYTSRISHISYCASNLGAWRSINGRSVGHSKKYNILLDTLRSLELFPSLHISFV
jgi:hypothetical protein